MAVCGFGMFRQNDDGKIFAKKSCARAGLPLIKQRIEGLIAV